MDAAQWPQDANNTSANQVQERKVRPQNEQALNCPRCNSTNTKFCYYNNYSLTQPRYFCKGCRRYWTQGGSLRNVPVGGGSRKNRRSVSSASSSSAIPKAVNLSQFSSQNFATHKGQDLSLPFQSTQEGYLHNFSQFLKLPKTENSNNNLLNFLPSSSSSSTSSTLTSFSSLDLLRTGITYDALNSFNPTTMSDSNMMFNMTRFNLQEFKPLGGFLFQGNGIEYGTFQGNQENGGRIVLPLGAFNQQNSLTKESDQNTGQGNSTGCWSGTLGGRSC